MEMLGLPGWSPSFMEYLIRIALGYFLILLGVAALAVPILPSSIFIAPGVLMLSGDVPFFARIVCRLERRFPRTRRFMARMRTFLEQRGIPPSPAC